MSMPRFSIVESKLVANSWVINDKCNEFVFPTFTGDKKQLIAYCNALNRFQDKVDGVILRCKRELYGDYSYD